MTCAHSITIDPLGGLNVDFVALASFGAAFFLFAASPGPDNMTIVASAVTDGPAAGIAYGAGTVVGILLFLMIAAFGLSLFSTHMSGAMTLLRYAGALWLIWTGIALWTTAPSPPAATASVARPGVLSGFLTGIACNLGNPKMPLFYMALLPNIFGADLSWLQIVAVSLVILAVEAIVISGHVILANRARRAFQTPRIMRRVNRIAGGTLIGTGVASAAIL